MQKQVLLQFMKDNTSEFCDDSGNLEVDKCNAFLDELYDSMCSIASTSTTSGYNGTVNTTCILWIILAIVLLVVIFINND